MDGFGVSDLSRGFNLRSLNVELNRSLVRLSEEVVSGRSADTTLRLNAQFSFLSQIETDLVKTDARVNALSEVAVTAEAQQTALGRLVEESQLLFNTLAVAKNSSAGLSVTALADQARSVLDTMVATLNTNQGGRYAFSGTDVTAPALASSEALLGDLTLSVLTATTETDLRAAVDDFFDLPGGEFETDVFTGAAQSLSPVNLGNGETVSLPMRADDPAFRELLKSVALIAIADDPALSIPDTLRRTVIDGQLDEVLNAQRGVVDLRAQLGFSEERIDRTTTRLEAERASLELARSDLLDVDPFESATALEAVRQQLETLFTVTARTQNLSLVNFL